MSINSDNLIKAKLSDAVKMMELKNIPSFLGFLNEREFSACKKNLENRHIKYSFYGGYENASRVFIAVLPDWEDKPDFPFKTVKFLIKAEKNLTHRDFLGTIMSLGISREKVGDILVKNNTAYAFVSESVAEFVVQNVIKVGGAGVEVEFADEIPDFSPEFEEYRKVVASNRADCVVGGITNLSREKSKNLILGGNLIVNHLACASVTVKINSGDILSLKGYGKFIIENIDEKNKKGRIVLKYKKFL